MNATEFNYTVTKASKYLKPYAMRLTKDADDANDLLQDTMLKAVVNKEKFSDGTNLQAWLYTIMKNTFITNYQKLIKKNTFIDSTDNLHIIDSNSSSKLNDSYFSFISEDIQKAMQMVEEELTNPFMLYFKGFKYHEIAETLNIPIGTVKNRIHIARKELKSHLKMYAFQN